MLRVNIYDIGFWRERVVLVWRFGFVCYSRLASPAHSSLCCLDWPSPGLAGDVRSPNREALHVFCVLLSANLYPSPTPACAQPQPLTLKTGPHWPKSAPFAFPEDLGTFLG